MVFNRTSLLTAFFMKKLLNKVSSDLLSLNSGQKKWPDFFYVRLILRCICVCCIPLISVLCYSRLHTTNIGHIFFKNRIFLMIVKYSSFTLRYLVLPSIGSTITVYYFLHASVISIISSCHKEQIQSIFNSYPPPCIIDCQNRIWFSIWK